jgi:flagellar FliL protein
MSDEQETEAEAPVKKGGRSKLIMVIGAVLLLALGGGGAAFVLLFMPADSAAGASEEAEPEADDADVVFVELPDLLVNLNVTGRRLRFLKFATALEVVGEEQAEAVRRFVPRILDSFHMYLRAINPEELEGAEGVYRIKEELLARTNDAVRPVEVRDVLIREMLVQ